MFYIAILSYIMSILRLENIDKFYGNNHVVKNLTLDVADSEFLTILGPSGCGKTTTLRMVAGFEIPDKGSVYLSASNVTHLPPYKRNVNTVFQNYALFPNMTVEENIAFGLQQKKKPKDEIKKKVAEMLDMVQMQNFAKRKPAELSGGQQQRVAIARAVANDPAILLLDEPLGALDLKLRKQMQFELKSLQQQLNYTFIYVTHDQEEALTMSDRIAVMNEGIIDQLGSPVEIYNHPSTEFVAGFIGDINKLKATVTGPGILSCYGCTANADTKNTGSGKEVKFFIRPEDIMLNSSDGIEGTVIQSVFAGTHIKYEIKTNDGNLIIVNQPVQHRVSFSNNQPVFMKMKEGAGVVFE